MVVRTLRGLVLALVFSSALVLAQDQSGSPVLGKPTQMGLSDIEKERIRLEEAYRHEVRLALKENDESARWSLPAVLNEPFTLWTLSSIVLAAFGRGYASYSKAREQKASSKKLLVEISTRIERGKADVPDYRSNKRSWVGIDTEKSFPEFEGRDFLSLVVELQLQRPDDKVVTELHESARRLLTEPSADKTERLLNVAAKAVEKMARA